MITRPSSEKEVEEKEVSVLREQVGYLQRLIAELLLKNQQLREAIDPEYRGCCSPTRNLSF